jgi:glycosyltransferase involved in cell wall biosynthesis
VSTTPAVAFINNFPGPTLGGGEVQLLTLLRATVAAGGTATVVCAAGSALERELGALGGVDVIPVEFTMPTVLGLAQRLRAPLTGAQVVQGTGFLTNIVARAVGASIGAAVVNAVMVVPGAASLDGESGIKGWGRTVLDRYRRSEVGRFVAVSNAVAEGLVQTGVQRARITVVPNGVDAADLRMRASMPLEVDLPAAARHVGFVGRLERIKGCEYFIEAAGLIAVAHPDVAFVIAGAGSLEAELRARASASPAAGRIRFVGHVNDPAPLMSALDVVCVPSLSEASGLTAIESLALGVPVVASEVGGLPDVVVDGRTGVLVPPADAGALAAAVGDLLTDRERAESLGRAGREHVEQHFTMESMVAGYRRVYDELARQPGR